MRFNRPMKTVGEYKKFFEEADQLGKLLGHKIISISREELISEYEVKPRHFNPNGILHGGTLYSLMDSAQGAFVHFNLDPSFKYAATGTASIRYNAPVRSGKVTMRTWLKEQQGRKIYVNSTASDEAGKVVAQVEEVWIATLK
jgi:uncharacterized protein (TIGR00369 family)